MTSAEFVRRLRAEVPQFSKAIDQHTADNDEILLHVLLGDLARTCVAAWESGDEGFNPPALGLLEAALTDGNDYVANAVSVSFVEDVGPWDSNVHAFIESWPPALLRDALRAGFTR